MSGMEQQRMFEIPAAPPSEKAPRSGARRLRYAVRDQIEIRQCALDDLLPPDHQARIVWSWARAVDWSALYERIQAVQNGPGQAPADPRILLALWLYATLRGVGSARELDRRCRVDIEYRWICGGVSMNYHTLADFRTQHLEYLDQLLTSSVAALLAEGLVTLDRVAQDGMKVRAAAGAASFRRKPTLEEALKAAEQQVAALRTELEQDPAAGTARQRGARERAAAERVASLQKALEHLPAIEAAKKPAERSRARASTTDPEARVMKMADGGFRPAFNVQLATTVGSQIITGVDVVNSGGDQGKLAPMVQQHQDRYDEQPREMLVDGGFAKKDDIDQVSPPEDGVGGTRVYAPVMKSKDPDRDAHEPRDDDSPAVAEWRARMATPEAQKIYKERASTAECVNAIARNRGLQRFLVRGLRKAKAVILWYVLAHNLMRAATLRAQLAAASG